VRKPGALAGSAALAQARAAGVFTSVHDAFWAAARARRGDGAGTWALIEVLLLHRRMPPPAVIAGMRAALAAGSCSADVVAVEARKHPATAPDGEGETARQALAGPRRSRAAVVTLPRRQAALPPDRRPAPSVAAYGPLLSVPPASRGSACGPGRHPRRADRHRRRRHDRPGLPDPAAAHHPHPPRRDRRRRHPPAGLLQRVPSRAAVGRMRRPRSPAQGPAGPRRRLPRPKRLEDFDYAANPNVPAATMPWPWSSSPINPPRKITESVPEPFFSRR
jgi:hypothetical protein